MRVDYHLHPNLPLGDASLALSRFWDAVGRNTLDAFICAEHVFKDAPRAYRAVAAAKPKHIRCHAFPGVELASSDGGGGVDVIAFAERDWYDDHPTLLEPFSMSLAELLAYLDASDLHYFIPHPRILKTPLLRLYPTDEAMQEFLAKVPAYEAANGSFLLIDHLCTYPIVRRFLGGFREALRSSAVLNPADYSGKKTFIAVGSDAHHPSDIGYCVEMPGDAGSRHTVFQRLTTNTDVSRICLPQFSNPLPRLVAAGVTAFHEWGMRKVGQRQAARLQSAILASERELA